MSDPVAPTGKTILIVDDEAGMVGILERRLQSWGYAVIVARDGFEGIEQAKAQHPDLILMDIMMPRLDGLEACRRLKADERTRQIPVLIVTAKVSKTLPEDCRSVGAEACIQKPFDRAELQALITKFLAVS